MEIKNKTQIEKDIKGDLEKVLTSSDWKKVTFFGPKRTVMLGDSEIFNEIAQKYHIKEISTLGGFNYHVMFGKDYWTFNLEDGVVKKFKEKYGGNYTIK